MSTIAERERLTVLEMRVGRIELDVAEIKTDVKTLVAAQAATVVALATREARELAHEKARSQNGVWARFFSERLIALIAIVVAISAMFMKG